MRFERTTNRLKAECSTTELRARGMSAIVTTRAAWCQGKCPRAVSIPSHARIMRSVASAVLVSSARRQRRLALTPPRRLKLRLLEFHVGCKQQWTCYVSLISFVLNVSRLRRLSRLDDRPRLGQSFNYAPLLCDTAYGSAKRERRFAAVRAKMSPAR